jgi:hypothetical protein
MREKTKKKVKHKKKKKQSKEWESNWIQKLNETKCLGMNLKKKTLKSIESKTINKKNKN